MGDQLAPRRHPSGQGEYQAAEGLGVLLVLLRQRHVLDLLRELLESDPGVGLDHTARPLDQHRQLFHVVLVLDIADDLLDQVFDGHQSVTPAELVDHHRHMNACHAHLQEQVAHPHRRRHEQKPPHDVAEGERLVRAPEGQQIADMDHADDVVERFAEDRQPRMARRAHCLDHAGERRRLLDGDDVGARHHDAADPKFAEVEHIKEHRALLGIGAHGLFATLVDHLLEDFAELSCAVSPARQAAQPVADHLDQGGLLRTRVVAGRSRRYGFAHGCSRGRARPRRRRGGVRFGTGWEGTPSLARTAASSRSMTVEAASSSWS